MDQPTPKKRRKKRKYTRRVMTEQTNDVQKAAELMSGEVKEPEFPDPAKVKKPETKGYKLPEELLTPKPDLSVFEKAPEVESQGQSAPIRESATRTSSSHIATINNVPPFEERVFEAIVGGLAANGQLNRNVLNQGTVMGLATHAAGLTEVFLYEYRKKFSPKQ